MVFNTLSFILFFIVVCGGYFILPHKYRWSLLLCSSYFFYMCWNATYALLMLFSTIVTFLSGVFISRSKTKKNKRVFLILSLVINLGILGVFKYFNFFNETIALVVSKIGIDWAVPNLNVLLPVGISFYTFQALSYTLDVYKKDIEPIRHFGKYALFVSFFPQLVAGPIERSKHLIPQFEREVSFDFERIKSGALLASWGFIKKMIVADRVAIMVNNVYNNISDYDGSQIAFATVMFAVQIYCDFSAYSDIARGCARILGFDLMKNFNAPYLATSMHDFWKRWHISLTSWFRDYLYIPLGGNRVSKPRYYFNLIFVFLVSGLWHGASFNYILWGALHGGYQMVGHISKNIRGKIRGRLYISEKSVGLKIFRRIFVFTLVCLAWVFFRADSTSNALFAIERIATMQFSDVYTLLLDNGVFSLGLNQIEFTVVMIFIILIYYIDLQSQNKLMIIRLQKEPILIRWIVYLLIFFSIIVFGVYGDNILSEFIYFQF